MRGTKTMYNPEVETATRTEMESLQLILHQIRPVEFAPGFLSSSLDKLPLKNPMASAGGFNFIQPGFEPPLN